MGVKELKVEEGYNIKLKKKKKNRHGKYITD